MAAGYGGSSSSGYLTLFIPVFAILGAACTDASTGSGTQVGTSSTGASEPAPHCLVEGAGGAGEATYGCTRAPELDATACPHPWNPGWSLAYQCPCIDDDCWKGGAPDAPGAPCYSDNKFCPECVQSAPREIGLGCGWNESGSAGDQALTFCCSPDHGMRCVRDLGSDENLCNGANGYPSDGKPFGFLCVDEDNLGAPVEEGPFADCVAVLGYDQATVFCCLESVQ